MNASNSDPPAERPVQPFTRLNQLLEAAGSYPPRSVAVAAAHDRAVIQALADAHGRGFLGRALLFGPEAQTRALLDTVDLPQRVVDLVDQPHDHLAAEQAAQAVRDGRADVLMKGKVHTDDFLRGVIHKETGLRSGHLMSQCFVIEHPLEQRLLIVTDAGMNIAPTLQQKAEIALNAIYLAEILGVAQPRVAALAAVEVVNPGMQATVDAAVLAQMSRRGQFSDGIVDGPFAMDNAVSKDAAALKGLSGPVAGVADVLLMPSIEAGNIMVKTCSFLCGCPVAGVLVGASAPVVLTSRADSALSKLHSVALAILMASIQRKRRLKIGVIHY